MTKNTGRRQEENESDDETIDEGKPTKEFDSFGRDDVPDPGYRSQLNEFLELAKHFQNRATFYLYRVNGRKRSIIKKTDSINDIPDENETGLKYGSGTYEILMTAPGSNGKKPVIRHYDFDLDQSYDDLRLRSTPYQQVPVAPDSGESLVKALTLLQGLIGTLAPFMRPDSPPPDMQKMINDQYNFMGGLVKKSMMENMNLMHDYQRKLSMLKNVKGDEQGGDGEEEDISPLVQQIMPFITEWLPKLMSGGAESRVVKNVVRGSAMFKEITKSRKMVTALIKYLDNQMGEEETDKVLRSLSMRRIKAVSAAK